MAVARERGRYFLPNLEITRMRRRHLRRVLSIEGRVYPRPWSASLFLAELSQRSARSYLVARHGSEVIGYAGMMFSGTEAHVTNIAVDPDFHGYRVGSRLLVSIITEALGRGTETISLEVRVSNRVAQAMYEKFGFSVVGIRKGYYIETHEDAYVMVARKVNSTDHRLRLKAIREEIDAALEEDGGG
jgi:[ribosomal protein S18]-alanine N-acetyltransferase